MDLREHRINLPAAAWRQEIHRPRFHQDRKRQAQLRAWLDHSKTHRDAFHHALNVWTGLKQVDVADKRTVSSIDARLVLTLRTRLDPHPRWWGVAAMFILSVLLVPIFADRLAASGTVLATREGEFRTMSLGDGTIVNLNSATGIAVES